MDRPKELNEPSTSGLNKNKRCTESRDRDGKPNKNIPSTSREETAHETETCTLVPRRHGTQNKGQEYEREILLYMAACLSQNVNIKDFRIVCNADDLGVWDDVVARVSFAEQKNDILLFVQSKHFESEDTYVYLVHSDSCKHPCSEKKHKKMFLTVYKNDFKNLIMKRANEKNVTRDINTDMYKLLAGIDDKDHFACIFTNAQVKFCNECMKLDSKIFTKDHPLYFLNASIMQEAITKGNYQQFDYEKMTEEDDTFFYEQLFIFSCQPSYQRLPIADQLGPDFNQSVMSNLDRRIQEFMERKSAEAKPVGQILTKEEFEIKCLEAALIHNNWLRYDVPKKPTHQVSDKFKELWRKILSQNIIINLVKERIEGITPLLASYYQYTLNDNPKEGMDTNDLLFLLWREEKISLSIKSKYTTNFFQVLKTFKNLQKRFIIFCDEDCPELTEYKLNESVMTYVNEIPNLQQIIPEILKVEVSLQGQDLVPLSEILGECEVGDEILNKLPISQLLVWTMNIKPEQTKNIEKSHRIGPELTRPRDNYLRRTFTLKQAEKNVEDEQEQLTEEDVLTLAKPGVHIITGDPGMGKSTVLQALAHRYSLQNFVIYVKLRDCLHDIDDKDEWPASIFADPIQYLFQKMADNAEDDIIAKSIMEIQKAGNRLGIFLDAYDEILPLHGERITSLIESILEDNDVTIFCTTRPHAEKEITTRADAKCFKLSPLTQEQIIEYLTTETYEYIRRQLDYEFLSNPLHLNMISQIYGNENRVKITKSEMYKMFIQSKLKIFNDKKKTTKNDAYVSNRNIMKNLRILAMADIFGAERVISKEVTSKDDLDKILDEIRNQNIGIGEVQETRQNFQFIHRTFAEYLVAEWLLCKEDQDILNRKYLKYFFVNFSFGNFKGLLSSHMDLWYSTRKYLLVNCVHEGNLPRWYGLRLYKEFVAWMKGTNSHLNVTGPTLVDSVNNDYPTRKPLTEDQLGSSTKLLTAINAENKPLIESVLKSEPTILETGLGIVAFNLAISTGNENIVKLLLKSRSTLVDEQDVDGNTGLHIACGYGYSTMVILLLKNNANVINNNKAMTPLGMATKYANWEIWKIEDIYNQKLVENSSSPNDLSKALLGTFDAHKWDTVDYLLAQGADPESSDDNGWTAMHFAANKGEPEILEMLLSRGLDVNARTKNGDTPFAIACGGWRNKACVKWLLEHGANPKASNDTGWTAMHFAAKEREPEILEMLSVRGLDINARTKNGDAPLVIACSNWWSKACVEWLLEHGANPKTSNDDGWTAMHFAAKGREPEIMEMLSAKGLDVNARTKNKETPLSIACSGWQNKACVKWLLEHGANPKASNDDGWTAMHFAAKGGEPEIIKMLSARGIDVNARTKNADTPLAIACGERWNKACVKWLLEHGANPKTSNDDGWTAMHFAAKGGEPEIIKMLSARGLDVNARTKEGNTPLITACGEMFDWNVSRWCQKDCVKCLLAHDADPKISNDAGWTAMHFAATGLKPEIMEMLSAKGLDVNQRTNDGQTPLAIARQEGRTDLVDWLLQNGSDGS